MTGTVKAETLGSANEVMTVHHPEGKDSSSSACRAVDDSHDGMRCGGHALVVPRGHCYNCQGVHCPLFSCAKVSAGQHSKKEKSHC